jgi:hypothetical protein
MYFGDTNLLKKLTAAVGNPLGKRCWTVLWWSVNIVRFNKQVTFETVVTKMTSYNLKMEWQDKDPWHFIKILFIYFIYLYYVWFCT